MSVVTTSLYTPTLRTEGSMPRRLSLIEVANVTGVPLSTVQECAEQLRFFATSTAPISPEMTWRITSKLHDDGHTKTPPIGQPAAPEPPVKATSDQAASSEAVPLPALPRSSRTSPPRAKGRTSRNKSRPIITEPKYIKLGDDKTKRARTHRPKVEQLSDQVVRVIALKHKVPVAEVIRLAKEFGLPVTRDSKLPQTTAAKIIERLEGKPQADSEHPEAAAAARRAAIIQREETDWQKFGFTSTQKDKWLKAGIPSNRAHLAAMCKDTMQRQGASVMISPDILAVRLDDGRTVLNSLLDGMNSVRLLERIATQKGVDLIGVNPELLRVCTSVSPPAEQSAKSVVEALRAIPVTAKSVPFIADAVLSIARLRSTEIEARVRFKNQIERYLAHGEIAALVSSYGKAFGVFHNDQNLRMLLESTSDVKIANAEALGSMPLLSNAAGSEQFYFLDQGATRLVFSLAKAMDNEHEFMLPPMGFAVLQGFESGGDGPKHASSILCWDNGENWSAVRTTIMTLRDYGERNSLAEVRIEDSSTLNKHAFAILAALNASRPAAAEREHSSSTRSSSASYKSSKDRTEGSLTAEVTVTYLSAFGDELEWRGPESRHRGQADHRWPVSGHWRRQWYPREGVYKKIWIKEHTAGPAEKPLLETRHVKVLRSPDI